MCVCKTNEFARAKSFSKKRGHSCSTGKSYEAALTSVLWARGGEMSGKTHGHQRVDIRAACSPCAWGPAQERDSGLSSSTGWGQSPCHPRQHLEMVGGDGAGHTQVLHADVMTAADQSPAMSTGVMTRMCVVPARVVPQLGGAGEGSPFFPGRAGHSEEIAKQGHRPPSALQWFL